MRWLCFQGQRSLLTIILRAVICRKDPDVVIIVVVALSSCCEALHSDAVIPDDTAMRHRCGSTSCVQISLL